MSAVRLLSATLAVGVVPGALATMLCRPRPQLTGLETIGFGIAISFGFVQLATITALSLHSSPAATVGVITVASILMAGCVVASPSRRLSIVLTLDELIVLSLLVALSVFLYNLGSPVSWYEDQVHVAIVRRLSEVGSPRIDNIYVSPDTVYTYPFPGTHYFMALVAKLSDIDALFVYHKLRFFWGPAALVMLHLVARAMFGTGGIAPAVTVTAVMLICSGAFAMVPGFDSGWGQLVPYSHASDVAMTVLFPALLVTAFGYFLAVESQRERLFFLAATVMLALTLTMVHVREMVQFIAYLSCFAAIAMVMPRFRPYLRSAMTLLAVGAGLVVIYSLWQAEVVGLVSDIVRTQRTRLMSIVTTSSVQTLLFTAAPALLTGFLVNSEQTTSGLIPLLLFAGPSVVLLLSRRPLVWLMSSSTLVYLAVMTLPLLAIPYIYLTYFEILYTPVRNVILFVYLVAGAAIYASVMALAQIDRTRVSAMLGGVVAGVCALLVSLCLNQSAGGFVAPLIAAYGCAFVLLWRPPTTTAMRIRGAAAILLPVLGLVALVPERAPAALVHHVSVRWTAALPEADRTALEQRFSLTAGEPNSNYSADVNVWNYALADVSQANIRALVNHPQVMDTNDIDRTNFTVPLQPPEQDHPYLGIAHLGWLQYPGFALSFLTAAFVWALGFGVPILLTSARGLGAVARFQSAIDEPFHRHIVPYALFVLPFAILTARPTLSPLMAAPTLPAGPDTPAALSGRVPCVTTPSTAFRIQSGDVVLPERTMCPPDRSLVEWVRGHVPVDAVFAVDRFTAYAPQVFMPQQAVVFPAFDATFIDEGELFGEYYRFFDDRMERDRVQPFFNSIETPAERAAFVQSLGVTHVLVNPPYYADLRAALDAMPDQFARRYNQNGWAVYEVTRKSRVAASR